MPLELRLECVGLRDAGLEQLLDAIKKLSSLKELRLNLGWNGITSSGAMTTFPSYLTSHTRQLQLIDLKVRSCNHHPKEACLRHNEIEQQAAAVLLSSLTNVKAIEYFSAQCVFCPPL